MAALDQILAKLNALTEAQKAHANFTATPVDTASHGSLQLLRVTAADVSGGYTTYPAGVHVVDSGQLLKSYSSGAIFGSLGVLIGEIETYNTTGTKPATKAEARDQAALSRLDARLAAPGAAHALFRQRIVAAPLAKCSYDVGSKTVTVGKNVQVRLVEQADQVEVTHGGAGYHAFLKGEKKPFDSILETQAPAHAAAKTWFDSVIAAQEAKDDARRIAHADQAAAELAAL